MTTGAREGRINRLVVESLVRDEADALDAAGTWREIARVALGKLREQHIELARQRARIAALCDDLRALRRVA